MVTVHSFRIDFRKWRRMCDTSRVTRMSEIHLELLNEMTPAGRALVGMLCCRIQEQDQIIASQQKRIEELGRRPGRNSHNSSLPPSSDRPGQQPVGTAKPKSRRKREGQAGHVRRTRDLIPTEHQIHKSSHHL